MGKKAAFSALEELHRATGKEQVISYGLDLCDCDHWNGTTFTVPKKGIYHFSISFMRDATRFDDEEPGKGDDARVELCVDGSPLAGVYAYVGESSVPRASAWNSFLLPLDEGKEITTRDWMYDDQKRVFRHVVFTGYRVSGL